MKNNIVPMTVNGLFLSIMPCINSRTPKNPKITGSICVNINIPDAINYNLYLFFLNYITIFIILNI